MEVDISLLWFATMIFPKKDHTVLWNIFWTLLCIILYYNMKDNVF